MESSEKFSKTRALNLLKMEDYHHKLALNLANQLKLINVFPTPFRSLANFSSNPGRTNYTGLHCGSGVTITIIPL